MRSLIATIVLLATSQPALAQTWSLGGIRLALGGDQTSSLSALRAAYAVKLLKNDDMRAFSHWEVTGPDGKIGSVMFDHSRLVAIERWYGGAAPPIGRLHEAMMDLQEVAGNSCSISGITPTSFAAIQCGQWELQWGQLETGEVWIWLDLMSSRGERRDGR